MRLTLLIICILFGALNKTFPPHQLQGLKARTSAAVPRQLLPQQALCPGCSTVVRNAVVVVVIVVVVPVVGFLAVVKLERAELKNFHTFAGANKINVHGNFKAATN